MTCSGCKDKGFKTKPVFPNSHEKIPCSQCEKGKSLLPEKTDGKLTPKQIENWKAVYGPLLTDKQIQKLRDNMQSSINHEFGVKS